MNDNRVYFLDYVRAVACFMVILVHCIEPFYLNGEGTYIASRSDTLWVTCINSLLRIAVPLFVMTSSYLLLPLRGDTASFFRRRAERVVIPFAVWSILYAVVPMWGSGGEVDITGNFESLALNFMWQSGHLWFVYMIIGVYLTMPILSPWLERVSKRGEEIFLGVWLFATAVPFIRELALHVRGAADIWGEASWNEFGMLYYVSGFVGFVVAAHYIRTYVDWSWRKTLAVSVPMFLVGYAITAAWFWAHIPKTFPVNESIDLAVLMEQSWRFCATGVAMTAVALFLVFKKIATAGHCYPLVNHLSKVSYGIYLMHIFILVAAHAVITSWGTPTPIAIFGIAIATFAISALLSSIISRLPGGQYIVG